MVGRRRLPPERRPSYFRSYEAPKGVRGLKHRAMLNSEAPMPLEESSHDDGYAEERPKRPLLGWRDSESRVSQFRSWRLSRHHSASSNPTDYAERGDSFSDDLSKNTSFDPGSRNEGLAPDLEVTMNNTETDDLYDRYSRHEVPWYRRSNRNRTENPMPPSVNRLADALGDPSKSNQHIFRLYKELPFPGVLQLPYKLRYHLLTRLANPANKHRSDARRYLVLVEDMEHAGLPLGRSLWTSAIHLVGRTTPNPTQQTLVKAVSVWQSMERQGVESDVAAFTALVDLAIKSGQFIVGDRLLSEMEARGMTLDRFGHTTKMYYFAKMGDLRGVRTTFAQFHRSGHIVDTTVLNCLLASYTLLDMRTANRLYEKMMEAQRALQGGRHLGGLTSPHLLPALAHEMPSYRKKNKETGRFLNAIDSTRSQSPRHHHAVQQAMPLTPDTRTFHILLSHHARRSGDLRRFVATLEDMETVFSVPPRGMVYLLLFEGFACHGGKNKQWSAERLRRAWKTFLRAVYESMRRYTERQSHRPQRIVWQNPFTESGPVSMTVAKPKRQPSIREPSGMFLPLPSSKPDARRPADNWETDDNDHDDDFAGDIDVDELFNQTKKEDHEAKLAEIDRQIANGVFLGRQIIIYILRAFGACCGPNEVLEVWFKLDQMWQPERRWALDVQVVREELEKQLEQSKANIER